MNFVWRLLLGALILSSGAAPGADQSSRTNFFLPQNPVAASYILGRLSNRELLEAPRGEFVDVALLERKGLDKKYRFEALDGLAAMRHTDRLTELLRGIVELDRKGEGSDEVLRDLAPLLLQTSRAGLVPKREALGNLALQGQRPVTREVAFAACVTADAHLEPSWSTAKPNPAQLADLILGVPFIAESSLRASYYSRLTELLPIEDQPLLRRAAIVALVSVPGHDAETFHSLAALLQSGVEVPTTIASLGRIPQSAWPKEALEPLVQSLLGYLRARPQAERTEALFGSALQFGAELASRLPPDAARALIRTLRSLGPTMVTLHAVYEQMRFDKDLIVVEAGKPVVITLQNDDAMPHNLAILSPGSLKEVGLAAEKMPPEPDAQGRLYVPASAQVLQATKLVNPGQQGRLAFDAPVEPGDYPFVCTFPGHWLRMAGTLAVVPDIDAYLASHTRSLQPTLTEWKLADFTADISSAEPVRSPEVGKELFSKLACIQCHRLGLEGYTYGPDLTELFKRYANDRAAILQQILEPSSKIEDRYRNFTLELKDGDSLVGMILEEDDEKLKIQTGPANSLIQLVNKSDIRQRRPLLSSPMPVGLLNTLSKSQIFDLLAYLQTGGSVPPHEHAH